MVPISSASASLSPPTPPTPSLLTGVPVARPTGGAVLGFVRLFAPISVSVPLGYVRRRSFAEGRRSCLATRTNQQVIAPDWRDWWLRSTTTTSSGIWFRLGSTAAKTFLFLPLSSSFFLVFFSPVSLWRLCGGIINAFWTTSLPAV